MNSNPWRRVLGVVLCALFLAAIAHFESGMAAQTAEAQSPPGGAQPPPPSDAQPPSDASSRGTFKSPAVPIRRLPPVASKGGCEPRYRNGMVGSCINDKPCRGFGVREKDGSAQCICYIRRGGCNEDERCSPEEGQCVADDESEFNREH